MDAAGLAPIFTTRAVDARQTDGTISLWLTRRLLLDRSSLLITERMVMQKELEWRMNRGIEDRSRIEAAIEDIRDGLVPRAEHERVWRNTEHSLRRYRNKSMS
jgi:hypothetical protein